MKQFERVDRVLLVAVIALSLFGVVMVLSTSMLLAYKRFNAPYSFFFKQIAWTAIGYCALFAAANVKIAFARKSARWLFLAMAVVLVSVLFFGKEINGARRWFDLGFTTFQPSELMKVVMIIFLADYLDRKKSRLQTPRGFLRLAVLTAAPLALILVQPDLGGVVVIMAISFAMFFLAGVKFRYMAVVAALGLLLAAVAIARTPYRLARVKHFVTSFSTVSPAEKVSSDIAVDSQQGAAIAALSRGGWLGEGFGNSRLKLFYLPEPHTDFIFAIIGEELGYFGAVAVLAMFVLLFVRGFKIASSVDDLFVALSAAGITLYFTVQALFHVGVSAGVLPTKGLTLPFISFGGSSLIVSLAAAGFLLNLSSKIPERTR